MKRKHLTIYYQQFVLQFKQIPYTGEKLRIPTKVVLGCNPGGKGHKWVKKRFIDNTVVTYDPITNAPLETKTMLNG